MYSTPSKSRKKRKSLTKLDDAIRKRRLRQTESFSKRERAQRLAAKRLRARFRPKQLTRTALSDIVDVELSVTQHSCNDMMAQCRYCDALHFPGEQTGDRFTICCHNGKVMLTGMTAVQDCPPQLRELLTSGTAEANSVREHIRNYNSALAFASLGAQK